MLDLLALQTANFAHQKSLGGEDRNRTYPDPAHAGPTTVLKTARATRHPSLSGRRKTSNAQRSTSNVQMKKKRKRYGDYLCALICAAIASKSGHSPVSSLEEMSSPLTRISKAPPPDAINLGFTPAAFRMRAANLAAFGS